MHRSLEYLESNSNSIMACSISRILRRLQIFVAVLYIGFILSVFKSLNHKSKLVARRQDFVPSDFNVTTNTFANFKPDGRLNVHLWRPICGNSIDTLRKYVLFPRHPTHQTSTSILKILSDFGNFGERIFGFLHVPVTGTYRFVISSEGFSELWLSSDEDPNNARLICRVGDDFNAAYNTTYTESSELIEYQDPTSQNIYFEGGKLGPRLNRDISNPQEIQYMKFVLRLI